MWQRARGEHGHPGGRDKYTNRKLIEKIIESKGTNDRTFVRSRFEVLFLSTKECHYLLLTDGSLLSFLLVGDGIVLLHEEFFMAFQDNVVLSIPLSLSQYSHEGDISIEKF